MMRRGFIKIFAGPMAVPIAVAALAVPIAVAALLVLAFSVSANAEQTPQPPWNGCYAVDKREYASAKKQKLLHGRGTYVRTGRLLRRYYWYCP
jgi:hypothetical protein